MREFGRRPTAALRPWREQEDTRGGVGWSRGCTGGGESKRRTERARGGLIWRSHGSPWTWPTGTRGNGRSGHGRRLGAVYGVRGSRVGRREGREGAGTGQRRRACEAAHLSPRAAGARARGGSRRRSGGCEFRRRSTARLRPWWRMETARREVGWSRGCTGGREIKRSREEARGWP